MKTLQTVKMKPNPASKDRTRRGASETQLGAEWADIKNIGARDVDLSGITLSHRVMTFKGTLKPGQVMRVHTGKGPQIVLRQEDLDGADFHLFSGHDQYVWNNDCGDCASLWEGGSSAHLDKACYDCPPPDGVILHRVGDKLVPATAAATSRR
jgi:hypothetical protein